MLSNNQYIIAGDKEMTEQTYEEVNSVSIQEVKEKLISYVDRMKTNGEISDKISEYLLSGDENLSRYYHLIKTQKSSKNYNRKDNFFVQVPLQKDKVVLLIIFSSQKWKTCHPFFRTPNIPNK